MKLFPDRKGFYVDIGAHDGKSISNTLLLDEHGWSGICADPLPAIWEKLVESRPNAYKTNKAIWHTTGQTVEFATVEGYHEMLSGINGLQSPASVHHQHAAPKIQVETLSLNDLLCDGGAPPFIEYLSLDTEGSELDILSTFDFSRWTFGLIDVEVASVEPKRSNIRKLLTDNGYVFLRENAFDDVYVHSSILGKARTLL